MEACNYELAENIDILKTEGFQDKMIAEILDTDLELLARYLYPRKLTKEEVWCEVLAVKKMLRKDGMGLKETVEHLYGFANLQSDVNYDSVV